MALNERIRSEATGKASKPYHSGIETLKPKISRIRKIKSKRAAVLTKI
jgi:hypothetical protein